MPNTPAQIGEGMTAWTATPAVSHAQEREVCAQVAHLLGAVEATADLAQRQALTLADR